MASPQTAVRHSVCKWEQATLMQMFHPQGNLSQELNELRSSMRPVIH